MGPLYPRYACSYVVELRASGKLKRDPCILREVVLRSVAASVEIKSKSRGSLLEWLAKQVDTANYDGQ